MNRDYGSENSGLIFHADIIFLFIAGMWVYGIYTTFLQGYIPLLGWHTDHNIILGILWAIVIGLAAPIPAKSFRQIVGMIAILKKGYIHVPFIFLNLVIQLYFWIIFITAWFPSSLPVPFQGITGGFFTGVVFLIIFIPICAIANTFAIKIVNRLLSKNDTLIMPGKFPLSKNKRLIRVDGKKYCLNNLITLLYIAANEPSQSHFEELLKISNNLFEPIDDSRVDQFEQQLKRAGEYSQIPEYDTAYYFKFGGSGAWSAANVNGSMELLFNGNNFVQFGIQLTIFPVMFFGTKKSVQNAIEKIKSSLEQSYSKSISASIDSPEVKIYTVSNKSTHSYFSIMRNSKYPIVTFRIGNRDIWDGFDT
ncbi:MAG: hypothetical protein WDZ80_01560 [Candidatus Paceibacterota bacterium]